MFDWNAIGQVTLADGKLSFPRSLGRGPAVYRLWIETGHAAEVYIGETVNLARRAGQYRRGDRRQRTSRWVHESLLARLQAGARVTMERLVDASYAIDADEWPETNLNHREQRLILENAALAVAFAEEIGDDTPERATVLNKLAAGRVEPEG
jgi:hypothetical protein